MTKRNKTPTIEKEKVRSYLFEDNMNQHTGTPTQTTKKHLRLISDFRTISGYIINVNSLMSLQQK
jgi:hypothetical protein